MRAIIDARDQAASTSRGNVAADDQTKEIEKLKKDLGGLDFARYRIYSDGFYRLTETLKGQARSQAAEYDRLADQYNKETGKPVSDKRKD